MYTFSRDILLFVLYDRDTVHGGIAHKLLLPLAQHLPNVFQFLLGFLCRRTASSYFFSFS